MTAVTVTKEQFVESFSHSRAMPQLSRRFASASHRVPTKWAKMLSPNRTWPSPDNINSRIPYGAFVWALHYYGTYEANEAVTIGAGVFACLLLNLTFVERLSDNLYFLVLSRTEHVAVAVELTRLNDDLFRAEPHDVAELFATRPEGEYLAIPWIVCPPIVAGHCGVFFRQIGPPIPLIQHVLKTKIAFSDHLLRYIVACYPLIYNGSTPRADLIQLLVNHVFSEGHAEHLERARQVDGIDSDEDYADLADPRIEMLLESECMDTADFEDFSRAVKKKRKLARVQFLQGRIAATRSRGRGRGRGRGKGAGKGPDPPDVDLVPVPVPDIDLEPVPVPAVDIEPVPVPVGGPPVPHEHGISGLWGKFIVGHRLASEVRPESFWGRCPLHLAGTSRSGLAKLFCTKDRVAFDVAIC